MASAFPPPQQVLLTCFIPPCPAQGLAVTDRPPSLRLHATSLPPLCSGNSPLFLLVSAPNSTSLHIGISSES